MGSRHQPGHGAHHGHGHGHDPSGEADRRWLGAALALIVTFMAVEVVVGLLAHSLALLSDAAHMLTDAAAIALALVAMRLARRPPSGDYTYGLKRAEILSAQANGLTLLLLAAWLTFESFRRLLDPPPVGGLTVLVTAVAGIVVNLAAAWFLSRANRASLNVEGAFQHVLNDLFGFVATAVAGLVVLLTGWARADALASLVVVVLMVKAGLDLVKASGRIFLEAAPDGVDPAELGRNLAARPDVVEVHDLHVWQITSGEPALSAHVLVAPGKDCHGVRHDLESLLAAQYAITHTTLQVDHAGSGVFTLTPADRHCADPHGETHPGTAAPPELQ
jgi:cobalt-zinc-cadmium efflux system protein